MVQFTSNQLQRVQPWAIAPIVSLSLSAGLALMGFPTQAQSRTPADQMGAPPIAEQRDRPGLISTTPPPPPTNPGTTQGGGRRTQTLCPQDAASPSESMIALSPVDKTGTTLAERPTVWVYVPSTQAQSAEFSLFDATYQGIYQTTFALPTTPGFVAFTLPSDAPPLSMGEDYSWTFVLICDPMNRQQDRLVRGGLRRVEVDPEQRERLEQSASREQAALYEEMGIWYEAVTHLLDLQSVQPDAAEIEATWNDLLQTGGLDPERVPFSSE